MAETRGMEEEVIESVLGTAALSVPIPADTPAETPTDTEQKHKSRSAPKIYDCPKLPHKPSTTEYRIWWRSMAEWRHVFEEHYDDKYLLVSFMSCLAKDDIEQIYAETPAGHLSFKTVLAILDRDYQGQELLKDRQLLADYRAIKKMGSESLSEYLSRYRQVRAKALVAKVIEPSQADFHDLLDSCHLTETQHSQILQELKRAKRDDPTVDALALALDELKTLEEMYGLRRDQAKKTAMISDKKIQKITKQTAHFSKGKKKGQFGSKGKGAKKGSGKGSKGGGKGKGDRFGKKPGDWTCPACSANVFASKDKCFKCGAGKPGGGSGEGGGGKKGGGKGGSGGKGGPYRGGKGGQKSKESGSEFKDWTCGKCSLLVFGRTRAEFCPKCGGKKA